MVDEDRNAPDDDADELLRRALLDESAAVAVSMQVAGLPLTDSVTIIFHGRRDLGTLQTYVTWGSHGAGAMTEPRPSSSTWSRPPPCATRWSAPTWCSTSGVSR
jgi:hypothetical protein